MSPSSGSPPYCLTLDLGNSAVKWAVIPLPVDPAGTHIAQGWFEYQTQTPEGQEAFETQLYSALQPLQAFNFPLQFAGCCVVPALKPVTEAIYRTVFHKGLEEASHVDPVITWLQPQSLPGLSLGDYPHHRLGADRWANLLAAHYEYPGSSILITDFGTATTLNLLLTTPQGHHFEGGQILPGYQTFASILAQKTAQLPPPEAGLTLSPVPLLGQDTRSSIQAGQTHGYPAMIIAMIEAIQASIKSGPPLILIATGGLVSTLTASLKSHFGDALLIDPNLTLRGVAYSLQR